MSNNPFLTTLNEFIQTTDKIIDKLNEELDWIKGHHDRCRVAKTVGTPLAVGGAVVLVGSLILAPITGGASIVAATGYAAAVGTTGAAINLATDISDMITQRIENSQIKDICARRNDVARRLTKHFENIQRGANDLKALGLDETSAFTEAFAYTSKGYSSYSTAKDILSVTRSIKMGKDASSMLLRSGGYIWKGMRLQSETLMKILGGLGFQMGKTGAMAIVRTSAILLNGFFAIYDVYSLVQCLKNNHPTADAISKLIQQMREELENIKELRNYALAISNN